MSFAKVAEAFLNEKKALLKFCPFPPASHRDAYENLPPDLKKTLVALGEDYLGYSYPPIYATTYMAFKRTGNRVDFEDIYFQRRYALNSLVVAECVENKGRFLDDIINGIFVLCEESGWQLPPHNSYIRDTPSEILPDRTRPVLDLFACETAAQLSCICYLLKDTLDSVSPFIVTRIRYELENRIFAPYIHEHFWWMGQEDEPMCNWTPWCTANVLVAAFLADCPQGVQRAVLQKAAKSLDFFLKDYGEDGCCDEGAQYFRHAGLCLDTAADLLNRVTDGAFSHLYREEKMKNMAAYIMNVHVDDKYYFNFADCSPVAGRAGVREYLFGQHTGQPQLMLFAAKDFQAEPDAFFRDESYLLNLYLRLQNTFTYAEIAAYDTDSAVSRRDIYYPSIGLFIAGNDSFRLAVKAGDNDDNHNHNDTGSITLYKNGSPIFADIGVESYCAKTFSDKRYEIWTMQSGYHNLPTINGCDQLPGPEHCATEVSTLLTDTLAHISMELAAAYPAFAEPASYVRTVAFDKERNRITLTDVTDCKDIVLNFITYHEPIFTGLATESSASTPSAEKAFSDAGNGTDTLRAIIGDAAVTFLGAKLLAVETLPITDRRLQTAWNHDLYRIRLQLAGTTFRMEIL